MLGLSKFVKLASFVLVGYSVVSHGAMAEVKIGALGGFTGPIEGLAPAIFAAGKLAVKNINDQGGILGGQKLVLMPADTGCDSTLATNAADRLVNSQKVTAIAGAMCSGATIAAANNVAIPAHVVMVSCCSTSPAVRELKDHNDLVFRTVPSDAYQGQALAGLLLSKGIDRIAITYVNNDYGKGFAQAVQQTFTKGGGIVSANQAHEEGKADYRAELGSLASSGADTLVILAYVSGSGGTILRQAIESGDFQTFVGGDGMVGEELRKIPGDDGMILTRADQVVSDGAEAFNVVAKEGGVNPNDTYTTQNYDAVFLLALAIEKNGSTERLGLPAALRGVASAPGEVILPGEWKKARELIAAGKAVNYEGAGGSLDFDKMGDVPGAFVELTVKNGAAVEVGPVK